MLRGLKPVLTAEEMRQADMAATRDFGVPSLTLMENAGTAVAQKALDMLSQTGKIGIGSGAAGRHVLIVCGVGNNGGDGFVTGRLLAGLGANVTMIIIGDYNRLNGDAQANYEKLVGLPLTVSENFPRRVDLVIDALLGTGLVGDVRPEAADAINKINAMQAAVLSIDVPSGMIADSFVDAETVVDADATITFAAPKYCHLFSEKCGKVSLADIGIPDAALQSADGWMLTEETVAALVPDRPRNAHKGMFGHAGLVVGSSGMLGAGLMAARASLRTGSGLTTLAVPGALLDAAMTSVVEAMTLGGVSGSGCFRREDVSDLAAAARKWDAVGIGCGLGQNNETAIFLRELLNAVERTIILDADGLNLLREDAEAILKPISSHIVLTPHPGEMARLLGTTTAHVQSNRIQAARDAADRFGCTVVLKGAPTITTAPGEKIYINSTGNSALAKGGSGDVLTGIITSLVAQGLSPLEASLAGVWIHGKCADMAIESIAAASVTATDCIEKISDVYKSLQSGNYSVSS